MYSSGSFVYDAPMDDNAVEISARAELLREAESLICGDRNETYGTPTQNFTNIADMWNVQFGHLFKDGVQFTAKDVGLAMILVKCARSIAQPKRDNFVDIAGYAACAWEAEDGTRVAEEPEAVTGVVTPKDPQFPFPWTTVTGTGIDHPYTINSTLTSLTPHECGPAC